MFILNSVCILLKLSSFIFCGFGVSSRMATSSKPKSYTIRKQLTVIERVKQYISKAQIKKKLGIQEGTMSGWMSEEAKLHTFLDKKLDGWLGFNTNLVCYSQNHWQVERALF